MAYCRQSQRLRQRLVRTLVSMQAGLVSLLLRYWQQIVLMGVPLGHSTVVPFDIKHRHMPTYDEPCTQLSSADASGKLRRNVNVVKRRIRANIKNANINWGKDVDKTHKLRTAHAHEQKKLCN